MTGLCNSGVSNWIFFIKSITYTNVYVYTNDIFWIYGFMKTINNVNINFLNKITRNEWKQKQPKNKKNKFLYQINICLQFK